MDLAKCESRLGNVKKAAETASEEIDAPQKVRDESLAALLNQEVTGG